MCIRDRINSMKEAVSILIRSSNAAEGFEERLLMDLENLFNQGKPPEGSNEVFNWRDKDLWAENINQWYSDGIFQAIENEYQDDIKKTNELINLSDELSRISCVPLSGEWCEGIDGWDLPIQEGKQNIVLESDEYSCPFCGQEGYLWNDVGMFRTIFENLVFDTYLDWLKHKFLILNE